MAYTGGYASGYQDGVVISPPTTEDPPLYAKAAGYGARIADQWVRLAPSRAVPMRYYTQDSLAPRTDLRSSSDENVLELGHAFSRSDLTGGAGLDFYPRPQYQDRQDFDNLRFWDSMNVDVSRSRFEVEYAWRLHHKLVEWQTPGNATLLRRTSDTIYVAIGNLVAWYDSLDDASADGSHDFSNPVDAICVIGDNVYVLSNNVIYKGSSTVSFTAWHTPAAGETIENIWSAKGRIIAHRTTTTPSNELVDMADGTTEDLFDSLDSGVIVNQVIDAGPVIVAALDSGYFYSYAPDDTQQLTPLSQTPTPLGEEPITIAYNQGTFAYITIDPSAATTVARFYAGEVLDSRFNNTIGNSQLIFEWDSGISAPGDSISSLVPLRDEIWWLMYEADVGEVSYVSAFRYDLVTRGYNRAHAVEVASDTDPGELIVFDDRLVFINDSDIWYESDTELPTVGWLISPLINFGLNTMINWVASVIDAVNLTSGGLQIELLRSTQEAALGDWNDLSWVSEQRIYSGGQVGTEVSMIGVAAKALALQVRVFPNSQGSPAVKKFALRGLPAHRDFVIELPVNISDWIEAPYRQPRRSPQWGDSIHRKLFNLQGKHLEVLVLDPPMTVVGIVDQIAEPVEYLTARGSQGKLCVVRVRGQRISSTSVTVGTAGLGVSVLGIGQLGIGEVTEQT